MDPTEGDFDAFFRREYQAQVRVAYVIVGDAGRAREIAQEAFARALQRWDRVSAYDRPGAWVRLVCVRLAVRSRDRSRAEVSATPARSASTEDVIRDLDLAS